MSPEQTIIIANMCNDYIKRGTFRYHADYIDRYKSCKNCKYWRVGFCEKAQNLLNSLE